MELRDGPLKRRRRKENELDRFLINGEFRQVWHKSVQIDVSENVCIGLRPPLMKFSAVILT